MTDLEFERYITSVIKEYGANYIDEKLIDNTPHKFSAEFERKMNILMGKSSKKIKITPKKFIIVVTAALLAVFIMAMSVSAVREAFIKFLMNIFDTHTVVQSVDDVSAPLDFNDKYEITEDMSDYELTNFSEDVFSREYIYESDNCTVYFTQYVNGCEGYYVNMYNQDGQIISWDNGDYVMSILVSCDNEQVIGKNKLIDMANSVQKIE